MHRFKEIMKTIYTEIIKWKMFYLYEHTYCDHIFYKETKVSNEIFKRAVIKGIKKGHLFIIKIVNIKTIFY